MNKKKISKKPIVSSSHLVSQYSSELSEFEFGLICANNAFQDWIVHCMSVAGVDGLNALDVLVLHNVKHRDRNKRLADICLMLNIVDTHLVSYALRKLQKKDLIEGKKQGKEVFYSMTQAGSDVCKRYREVRELCLVDALRATGVDNEEIGEVARVLRLLSGVYDQASRSARSF